MYFLTYSPPYVQNSRKNPQKNFSTNIFLNFPIFSKKMSQKMIFLMKKVKKMRKKFIEIRKFHFLIISLESYKKAIKKNYKNRYKKNQLTHSDLVGFIF
jgi:hypothetical protein